MRPSGQSVYKADGYPQWSGVEPTLCSADHGVQSVHADVAALFSAEHEQPGQADRQHDQSSGLSATGSTANYSLPADDKLRSSERWSQASHRRCSTQEDVSAVVHCPADQLQDTTAATHLYAQLPGSEQPSESSAV